MELSRLDSDREGTDMGVSAVHLNSVGHRGETKDSGAGRQEMSGVVVSVESYQVAVEDTQEDLSSNGKNSIEIESQGLTNVRQLSKGKERNKRTGRFLTKGRGCATKNSGRRGKSGQ